MATIFRERNVPGDEALGHGKMAHTGELFQVPDANAPLSVGCGEEVAIGRHAKDFNCAYMTMTWNLSHGDLAIEHDCG